MKKTKKILSLLLLLAMSVCAFAACNGKTAENVAEEFLNAWADGDGDKAASYCTDVDVWGDDDLKESAKEVAEINENMVFKIKDVTVTGDNAVVTIDIIDRGQTWEDKTLYLTKEDGTWKINGYEI